VCPAAREQVEQDGEIAKRQHNKKIFIKSRDIYKKSSFKYPLKLRYRSWDECTKKRL